MEAIFTKEPKAEDAPHLKQDHEWLLANLHENDVQAMLFAGVLKTVQTAGQVSEFAKAGVVTLTDEDRKVIDNVQAFAKRFSAFQKSHWPEKDPLQCT